jgi:hypothetical protein
MVVLLVAVEVGPQIVDAARQEGDLYWGAATILVVKLVLFDYFFAVKWHSVRASAGVYAAGEAPPRMISSNC